MSVFLKLIYIFNITPIKMPEGHFYRNWQADAKIYIEKQRL